MKSNFSFQILFASIAGIVISWIDSRPNWDDTALLVFMIFLAAFVFGFLAAKKFWAVAIAVSIWIPVFNIILKQNPESLIAFIPGFAGAWLGENLGKWFRMPDANN